MGRLICAFVAKDSLCLCCSHLIKSFNALRTLIESAYWKTNFLISQPKHMLWVLKRTVSFWRFFKVSKTYVKTDGYENIYNFTLKIFVDLILCSLYGGLFVIFFVVIWWGHFFQRMCAINFLLFLTWFCSSYIYWQIATDYLNQKSDHIHVVNLYRSFHTEERVIESGEVILRQRWIFV